MSCATFRTNLNKLEAIFSVTKKAPHTNFNGKLYVQLIVKDNTGAKIYEKSVEGTNAEVGSDNFVLKEGYTIEIYHTEVKNRLRSSDKIIDATKKTNSWLITKWGLQNQTLRNDPQQDLIKKINTKGMNLLDDRESIMIPFGEFIDKKQLLAAIKLLEEPYKSEYMNKFFSLFK